ncbi:MAG: hypothetical protein AUJ21_11850 [Anaerolineae bacterium CG1_02_58_13]|nr:MAG: hypothetical protein AUJ21_11850 [Anaerolineae bacterium CG1_02_58_13]
MCYQIPFLVIVLWIPKHLQKHGLEQGIAEIVRSLPQLTQAVGARQQGRNPLLLGQRRKGNFYCFKVFAGNRSKC